MRSFFLALLIALTVSFAPISAGAVTAGTCSLDIAGSDGGGALPICPADSANNFLLQHGYSIAQLNAKDILSGTPVNINNICRFVDARNASAAIAVMFGSSSDWVAFLNNRPATTNVGGCCIARTMHVSDIPVPTDTCNGGRWIFNGLVASETATTYIARVAINGQDLRLISPNVENADYPIIALPFDRDDIGSTLPTGAHATDEYIAKFTCVPGGTRGDGDFGRIPVGTDDKTAASANAVTFTHFRLQCKNANWTPIDPGLCVATTTSAFQSCVDNGHPSNWVGTVGVLLTTTCPSGQVTKLVAYDDCHAPTCTASDNTVPTECPSGQTGTAQTRTQHVCDGSNNGSGRDIVTVDTSGCTASCTPGQVGETFTEACGANFTGLVTFKNVRQCPSGTIVKTEVSNTCVCPASTDLGNVTRACPSGQTGNSIVHQMRTCVQAQPSGNGGSIPSYGICSCSITETPVSNTCTTTCTSGQVGDTYTQSCPSGQTGLITKRQVRQCPSGSIVEEIVSNTCTNACTPGQVGETFTQSCPSGQTGLITKRHVRQCPSGTIVDEVVTNTCTVVTCTPHEVSRSAVDCGVDQDGMVTTIVTHICDGSNNGAGRDVTSTENTCRPHCVPGQIGDVFTQSCPFGQTGVITKRQIRQCPSGAVTEETLSNTCANSCVPTRVETRESCPSGQDGYILVINEHVCGWWHPRHWWQWAQQIAYNPGGQNGDQNGGQQSIPNGHGWNHGGWHGGWGGGYDITRRENHCVAACIPSDVTSTRACQSGYDGQIIVHTQHICDGSNNGAGRDQITEDNQCHAQCTPGPTCNPYTVACPSGQIGQITRQNFRICPSGNIEVREISNTCQTQCVPSESHVDASCPSGQSGYVRTTTSHICDGSNNGTGRDVVTTDNQCHTICQPGPSCEPYTRACPAGQDGLITLRRVRVCPSGEEHEEVISNTCHNTCTPSESHTDAACPSGQVGVIRTNTRHICDGSNNGFGRDVVTTDNQCHFACTPNVSIFIEDCAMGYTGGRTTKTEHVCDGSNNGAGRDVVTVTGQACHIVCTPSSNTTIGACPDGQEGHVMTTTAHICDGSNNGAGRDTVTTDNQCHRICRPGRSCEPYTRACPAGQDGLITLHRVRVCPSGEEHEEVISNTCHNTCTPAQSSSTRACPSGYTGQIVVTSSHICDGSNNGSGRDTVSETNQCSIVITSGEGGGTPGGDGGGTGDGGGCGDGGGGDGGGGGD